MRVRGRVALWVRRAGAVCAGRLPAPGPKAGDSPGITARGRLLAVCCAVPPGSAGQAVPPGSAGQAVPPGSAGQAVPPRCIEGASRHGRPAPVIAKGDRENTDQSISIAMWAMPLP